MAYAIPFGFKYLQVISLLGFPLFREHQNFENLTP
jgi:hypothetical protein